MIEYLNMKTFFPRMKHSEFKGCVTNLDFLKFVLIYRLGKNTF